MERFEYQMVVWEPSRTGDEVLATLNILGGDGWEVVGLAPRASDVPMAGMGAKVIPEVVVLLKRRLA